MGAAGRFDLVIPNRRKAAVRNLLFQWSGTAPATKLSHFVSVD
jgi:hypothetical protein